MFHRVYVPQITDTGLHLVVQVLPQQYGRRSSATMAKQTFRGFFLLTVICAYILLPVNASRALRFGLDLSPTTTIDVPTDASTDASTDAPTDAPPSATFVGLAPAVNSNGGSIDSCDDASITELYDHDGNTISVSKAVSVTKDDCEAYLVTDGTSFEGFTITSQTYTVGSFEIFPKECGILMGKVDTLSGAIPYESNSVNNIEGYWNENPLAAMSGYEANYQIVCTGTST